MSTAVPESEGKWGLWITQIVCDGTSDVQVAVCDGTSDVQVAVCDGTTDEQWTIYSRLKFKELIFSKVIVACMAKL